MSTCNLHPSRDFLRDSGLFFALVNVGEWDLPKAMKKNGKIARVFRATLMSLLCAGVVPVALTSHAIVPAPLLSTNYQTGKITTNVTFGPLTLLSCKIAANPPPSLKVNLYLFWWDVKDDLHYGVPYMVRNEPQVMIPFAVGLLLLGCLVSRFLPHGRKSVPDVGSGEDTAVLSATSCNR